MFVVMSNDYPLEILYDFTEEQAREHCRKRERELNEAAKRQAGGIAVTIYVRAYGVPVIAKSESR